MASPAPGVVSGVPNQTNLNVTSYFPALGGGGGGGGGGTPNPSFSTVTVQDSVTCSTIIGNSALNIGGSVINVYTGLGMNVLDSGGGAGKLTVSSINCSTINQQPIVGMNNLTVPFSTPTSIPAGNGTSNIGAFSTFANSLYLGVIPQASWSANSGAFAPTDKATIYMNNKAVYEYVGSNQTEANNGGDITFAFVATGNNVTAQFSWASQTSDLALTIGNFGKCYFSYLGAITP